MVRDKRSNKPKLFHVDNIAEPMFGFQVGPGALRTHSKENCQGRHCVIHNPSKHHMRDWPLNWRADKSVMERLCSHGVGHDDPDDVAFRKTLHPDDKYVGSHGCDGCCIAPKK